MSVAENQGPVPEVHLHVDGELSVDDAEVLRDVIAAATQRRMTGHVLTAELNDVAEVIDQAAALNDDAYQARCLHRAGAIDATEALVRCLRSMVAERYDLIDEARREANRARDYAEDVMAEADAASDAAGRVADILGPR